MRILYLQYTNPAGYPPLEHSSRILADAGWEALFLGVGAFGTERLQFPSHKRITVKQMPACGPGLRQKVHFVRYCLWALWWTVRWRPDWIYASDTLACPAALTASHLGAELLYHEHDSPASTGTGSFFQRLCLRARTACSRRARACVLPNKTRAEVFAQQTQPKEAVNVVWNCPSSAEVGSSKDERSRAAGLRLFYHGSIVPDRLPETILHALATFTGRVSLTVAGYETVGSKGYVKRLEEMARTLGVQEHFRYIGTIELRSGLLEACRQHDVGLSLLGGASTDINMQAMTGASNKPFDYMSCGLPLLVSDLPDWRAMFVDRGFALACQMHDPISIAAAIRQFLDDPAKTAAMGEAGRRQILGAWNYEKQFEPVLSILQSPRNRHPAVQLDTTSNT